MLFVKLIINSSVVADEDALSTGVNAVAAIETISTRASVDTIRCNFFCRFSSMGYRYKRRRIYKFDRLG
jgi:hypothetical protein